jgi:uncharacterized membrane protein
MTDTESDPSISDEEEVREAEEGEHDRGDEECTNRIGAEIAGDRSDLVTVMTHFYRAEVERVVTWRTRFDEPSYWAVTVMAGLLAWAFSGFETPHYVLLIGMVTLTMFAFIEAHRYRTYEIWRSRVRLLQENFFADAFDPSTELEREGWREALARDLRSPALKISFSEAFARRLKRIYLPLLLVLLAGWLVRITVFEPGTTWVLAARIATIPGGVVVAAVAVFYGVLLAVVIRSRPGKVQGEFHGKATGWEGE